MCSRSGDLSHSLNSRSAQLDACCIVQRKALVLFRSCVVVVLEGMYSDLYPTITSGKLKTSVGNREAVVVIKELWDND
ncbi:hypothetical protein FOZ61_002062 [Perkinsus olseni]|uniref:Uncharacterized protein n=1 Tax=Perkinsus olseni TaxID=32597 RepID=A0A7J6LUU8_PEROL|nr:hypothetical protein FOZ61_002062 [Perkinsus olseni]